MKSVIGFLIILALVIFLLSNRVPVDIGFWPFGQVATLPLGAVVLAVLVLGFLLGLAFHLPHRFEMCIRDRSDPAAALRGLANFLSWDSLRARKSALVM